MALESRQWRAVLGTFLSALLVVPSATVGAQPADMRNTPALIVFEALAGGGAQTTHSGDVAVALEAIRSDPAASDIQLGYSDPASVLAAGALSLALAPASKVVFHDFEIEYNEDDLVSLYARDDAADTEIALVIQGLDVLGSVRRGAEVYQIQPLGDGLTAVYHYDVSQLRHHSEGWYEFMEKNRSVPEPSSDGGQHGQVPDARVRGDPDMASTAADSEDVINILVVYTPEAIKIQRNMDSFVQFAIDNTNRIYENSRMDLQVRAVHIQQTNYTQASHMRTDLYRVTHTRGHSDDPNGDMDEVHGLRDQYGADLVVLVVGRQSSGNCGWGWIPDYWRQPTGNWADRGFSVMAAQNCETLTFHTFAHEVGHNQGADHDPDNSAYTAVSYGHGFCNTDKNWNTIMSYSNNDRGDCRREIEYFSSPNLSYDGTLTGDATVRDNRRVLLETKSRVANFRQSTAPQTNSHTLPFLPPASNVNRAGFARIINYSNRAGTVNITAIDDDGQRFGPESLSLGASEAAHFNSSDLEDGNPDKGLPDGVGTGNGNWRLELTTDLEIEALAYIRTVDGFVTNMHEVAVETREGSNSYYVPFVNPGKNRTQESRLRLINPGSSSAIIEITGLDDDGQAPLLGTVGITLGAGKSRIVSAYQLENGGRGISGRLGAGEGKWRLLVSADREIQVMSLLTLPTGHLTNLSRGREGATGGTFQPINPGVWGAIATGWVGEVCAGYSWYRVLDQHDREAAVSTVLSFCQGAGRIDCTERVAFQQCGALAIGGSTRDCDLYGGSGANRSAAEQSAVALCGARYGNCRIPADTTSGTKAVYCNTGAGNALPVEVPSDRDTGGSSLDPGNSGFTSRARPSTGSQ